MAQVFCPFIYVQALISLSSMHSNTVTATPVKNLNVHLRAAKQFGLFLSSIPPIFFQVGKFNIMNPVSDTKTFL